MTAVCARCGERNDVETFTAVNASSSPELKAALLDGSLFVWECPHCGTHNLLRSPLLYHDPAQNLMVWLTYGDRALEEKAAATIGTLDGMDGYVLRFVDDAGSLIEKVKIFDAGLDDMAVELCKHVTKMELASGSRQEIAADGPMRFLDIGGADNEITLAYPSNGRMEMVRIGMNVYEDCAGIIRRNPPMALSVHGFCRVDAGWLSQFFR